MGASGHRMIAGGNSVVALAITPEPLVDNPTPCVMVWVGAPHDDTGVAQNTSVARLGPAGGERIQLATGDMGGFYIPICDANLLYIDVGTNADSVDYVIFA